MFCPQCGQEQASDERRFCSRCGFPLSVIAEVLAAGGVLAPRGGEATEQSTVTPRGRGVRQGVAILFVGWVITAAIAVLTSTAHAHPEVFIPVAAILLNGLGLGRIVYALLFQAGAPRHRQTELRPYAPPTATTRELRGANVGAALPPPQSIPVPNFQRPRAADAVPPPSVTEHTTKLLDTD